MEYTYMYKINWLVYIFTYNTLFSQDDYLLVLQ